MEHWIQQAIKRPGALRAWAKRNRARIKRVTGEDPFTKKGTLKVSVLKKLLDKHRKGKIRLSDTIVKRINLAKTLHKLRRR